MFPPPESYRPGGPADPDPLKGLRGARAGAFYRVMRSCHDLLFDERRPGFRIMRGIYRGLYRMRGLAAAAHAAEFEVKRLLFNCRDCGDCALPDTAYHCPESNCPKGQRNGPCGGTQRGFCEVYPDRPCFWTVVYRRLKAAGKLESVLLRHLPPRDPALQYTSGWANFYLSRDYRGRLMELPSERSQAARPRG